jgi:hypothetical protein
VAILLFAASACGDDGATSADAGTPPADGDRWDGGSEDGGGAREDAAAGGDAGSPGADAGTADCVLPEAFPTAAVELDALAMCFDVRDHRGGVGWSDDVTVGERLVWDEAHLLQTYANLFAATGNVHWLRRIADHGIALLRQRDGYTHTTDFLGREAPGWSEPRTRYVWLGFDAALMAPMVRFARLVAADAALGAETASDGVSFAMRADQFARTAGFILTFHEADYREDGDEAKYVFGRVPTTPACAGCEDIASLEGDDLPFNMLAFAAELHRELSRYRSATGESAEASRLAARYDRMARYFRARITTAADGGATWAYSTYTTRIEDVGHGNFDIQHAYFDSITGSTFGAAEMARFATTFRRFLDASGEVTGTLIDGTSCCDLTSRSTYFWMYLSEVDGEIWRRAWLRARGGSERELFVLGTLGYVRFVRGAR